MGSGFALKAADCLRVFGYVVGQEFESHKATELIPSAGRDPAIVL